MNWLVFIEKKMIIYFLCNIFMIEENINEFFDSRFKINFDLFNLIIYVYIILLIKKEIF